MNVDWEVSTFKYPLSAKPFNTALVAHLDRWRIPAAFLLVISAFMLETGKLLMVLLVATHSTPLLTGICHRWAWCCQCSPHIQKTVFIHCVFFSILHFSIDVRTNVLYHQITLSEGRQSFSLISYINATNWRKK